MRNFRLVLVLAVVYIDMLGVGLSYPVLPRLVQLFEQGDVSRAAYIVGPLAALYAFSQFLFAPLFGALSDRFGRRPLLLLSLAGSAASYLLMAAAPGLVLLAVARLIAGVMGSSFSTASAYVADITPPDKRTQSFGLIGAAFGLGFITGPVIGGLLGDIDLHLPFLAAGMLCIANLLFGLVALPESLAPEHRKAFKPADANPIGALREVGRYASIYPLMAIFVLALFANRVPETIWVLYTSYRFHWGPLQVGLSLAAAGVVFVVGQGWFTRILIPRIGEQRAIVLGLWVSILVSILYGAIDKGWMLYCVMPLAISGWTVAQPAVQGLMSRAVPADEQGLLQGAMASLTSLTSIVGPPVWTGLFGYFIGPKAPVLMPGAPFFASGAVFVLALLVALRWRRPVRLQPSVA